MISKGLGEVSRCNCRSSGPANGVGPDNSRVRLLGGDTGGHGPGQRRSATEIADRLLVHVVMPIHLARLGCWYSHLAKEWRSGGEQGGHGLPTRPLFF